MSLPKEFNKFDLEEPSVPDNPRGILTVEGLQKTGKTNLLKSVPKPVLYINYDDGSQGVIEGMPKDNTEGVHIKRLKLEEKENQQYYVDTFLEVKNLIFAAVQSSYFRSTFIDTGKDYYAHMRLAEFGKLDKVPPMRYGPINRSMKRLFAWHRDNCKNLIIVHRIGDEHKSVVGENGKEISIPTGNKIMDGWKQTRFETDIHLKLWKSDEYSGIERFRAMVTDCRTNTELEGIELSGSEINFANIVELAYPYWDIEDWDI